jgi:hypothetical protein
VTSTPVNPNDSTPTEREAAAIAIDLEKLGRHLDAVDKRAEAVVARRLAERLLAATVRARRGMPS